MYVKAWKLVAIDSVGGRHEYIFTNAEAAAEHFYNFCGDVDAGDYREVMFYRQTPMRRGLSDRTVVWVLQNAYDRVDGPIVYSHDSSVDKRGGRRFGSIDKWLEAK